MKKTITILSILICIIRINAQDLHEAPSMQVGLSGIKFSKGNLDPEIVAEIISEKQKEVKVKLIKTMLLKNLGVDNGLFYAYIDQSIEILTTEKDEETRVKNLLENTVNIAFVVGYADYYIQTLKKSSPGWNSLKTLALTYGIDSILFNKETLSLRDFAKKTYTINTDDKTELDYSKPESKLKTRSNEFVGVLIDLFAEQIRQNEQFKSLGLLRTNYLQNYISMNAYLSLKNEGDEQKPVFNFALWENIGRRLYEDFDTTARRILLETKQHVLNGIGVYLSKEELSTIRNYNTLLNFLAELITDDLNSENEKKINDYIRQEEKVISNQPRKQVIMVFGAGSSQRGNADSLQDNDAIIQCLNAYKNTISLHQIYGNTLNRRRLADTIFEQVKENLDVYIKYFGLIKSLSGKGNDWKKSLNLISNSFTCGDLDSLTLEVVEVYTKARKEITDLSKLSEEEIAAFKNINSFIEKLQYAELNRFEYIQTFEKEIKPSLDKLGIYSLEFLKLKNSMHSILNCIDSTVRDDFDKINMSFKLSFINVFTKIDEFDKVGTYADFLNQLSDAGDVFSDEEMRKSINQIITFVRSYVKVSNDNNNRLTLNLDVEGFLYNLQKLPYNKFRPLQFYFTVGANNTLFTQNLVLNESDTIRNYSFIGEKIGIKFKLWDYKYINSFSKGETFTYKRHLLNVFRGNHITYLRKAPPKEPTISNVHLIAYGSGILYNIINTGTTKNFNSPLVSIGIGITFFNDLDFNLSWGIPILKNKSFGDKSIPSFFNIGFDIQFIEYYNRLNQKRKSNQIQRKLVEAAK